MKEAKNNTTTTANTNATATVKEVKPATVATPTKKPYTRTVKAYYLFNPGKGFMLKNPKGVPTFGVDGELVSFAEMRQAKFARDFFVETARVADRLDILTKV